MIHLSNVTREAPAKAATPLASKTLATLVPNWTDTVTQMAVATWSTFLTQPASKVFGFPAM
ncbi:MAG: hypothetical protein GY851_03880 [bacterium]|nr:hypothetical protein [bacterium]